MSIIYQFSYPDTGHTGNVRPGSSHKVTAAIGAYPTLTNMTFSWSLKADHDQKVENLSATAQTIHAAVTTLPRLDVQNNGTIDAGGSDLWTKDGAFASYDGTTDFGGSSGGHISEAADVIAGSTTVPSSLYFLFTGSGQTGATVSAWCDSSAIYSFAGTGQTGQTGIAGVNGDTYYDGIFTILLS